MQMPCYQDDLLGASSLLGFQMRLLLSFWLPVWMNQESMAAARLDHSLGFDIQWVHYGWKMETIVRSSKDVLAAAPFCQT